MLVVLNDSTTSLTNSSVQNWIFPYRFIESSLFLEQTASVACGVWQMQQCCYQDLDCLGQVTAMFIYISMLLTLNFNLVTNIDLRASGLAHALNKGESSPTHPRLEKGGTRDRDVSYGIADVAFM